MRIYQQSLSALREEKKRIYRRFLIVTLLLALVGGILIYELILAQNIPDTIFLRQGEKERISFALPVSARIVPGDRAGRRDKAMHSSASIPVSTGIALEAGNESQYAMQVKLLGMLPMKTISLQVVSGKEVYIEGIPIGIYLKTKGILILDTGEFCDEKGNKICPAKNILQSGDYVLKINGLALHSKNQMIQIIEESDGENLVMTIFRKGQLSEVCVYPQKDETGLYKIGIWARDSAQGIGTLTFVTPEGDFGALGHGITDYDTGILLSMQKGSIYDTNIIGVQKGKSAIPGELSGILTYEEEDYLGAIAKNTECGIYGNIKETPYNAEKESTLWQEELKYPVGLKQEIKEGPAQIYCKILDTPSFYDVEITRIKYNETKDNQSIMLTVTDEKLKALTGGIVQGMSGSPIVQNGKVIGAVTHVLVDDPTKGYGIFIENMLQQ